MGVTSTSLPSTILCSLQVGRVRSCDLMGGAWSCDLMGGAWSCDLSWRACITRSIIIQYVTTAVYCM